MMQMVLLVLKLERVLPHPFSSVIFILLLLLSLNHSI